MDYKKRWYYNWKIPVGVGLAIWSVMYSSLSYIKQDNPPVETREKVKPRKYPYLETMIRSIKKRAEKKIDTVSEENLENTVDKELLEK